MFVVGNIVFFCGCFNDRCDIWVVDMVDIWEKMVFYLMVEFVDELGKEMVFVCEVGCSFKLMNGLVVFYVVMFICFEEVGFF